LWLDANDTSSVTIATGVQQWSDRSGNGRDFTQDVTNSQPTYTATLNGKRVISFNGSSNQLNNLTNIISIANVTIFAVGQRNAGNFGGYITSMDSSVGGDITPALLINSTNVALRGDNGTVATGSSGGFTGPAVITGVVTNYAPSIYVAGSFVQSQAAGGTSTPSSSKTAIGTYRIAAGNYLNGYIAEIICYSRALSTTERQTVERYLGKKWGLTVA
jgi:hypothetical protein